MPAHATVCPTRRGCGSHRRNQDVHERQVSVPSTTGHPFNCVQAPPSLAKGDPVRNSTTGVFDVTGNRIAGQYRDAFVVNVYKLNQAITPGSCPRFDVSCESSSA